jgi:hypothetical protein
MKSLQVPGKRWLSLGVLSLMAWMAVMGLLALAQESPTDQQPATEPSQSVEDAQVRRDQRVPKAKISREEAIEMVQAAGWMQPDLKGNFQSQRPLSRAELATVLTKAFQLDSRKSNAEQPETLKDVPTNHWAAPSIETVMRLGIMKGYRPGYFYPNQRINRAEAFSIMAQAYGVQQYDDETIDTILAPYSDAGQIPAWARKALVTALKSGFIDVGDSGSLSPLKPMTRGDMAYALGQYLKRLEESARPALN